MVAPSVALAAATAQGRLLPARARGAVNLSRAAPSAATAPVRRIRPRIHAAMRTSVRIRLANSVCREATTATSAAAAASAVPTRAAAQAAAMAAAVRPAAVVAAVAVTHIQADIFNVHSSDRCTFNLGASTDSESVGTLAKVSISIFVLERFSTGSGLFFRSFDYAGILKVSENGMIA